MTDEQRLSHQEISRRGGIASARKRTKEERSAMAKKAAQTMRKKYGEDYFKKIRQNGSKKKAVEPGQSPLSRLFSSILGTKKGIDS